MITEPNETDRLRTAVDLIANLLDLSVRPNEPLVELAERCAEYLAARRPIRKGETP